jgi:hypothetical protein
MLVLDYSSLFITFGFAGVGVHSAPVMRWVIFLGLGWVEESCVVCDAHLYLLHFHTGSFGASSSGEMVLFGVA